MRVLVTWGSKMGGTAGIAEIVASTLRERGFEVTARKAASVDSIEADAVIIGGSLYAMRWNAEARRFVHRHLDALRKIPVWMFSSGPLDDSADHEDIAPVYQVAVLMERVGAQGHATFGGRLEPSAKGFLTAAMAKKHAGDWRNPERIRAWATQVADALPSARAREPLHYRARSGWRLLAYGSLGWALCGMAMYGLLAVAGTTTAIVGHAIFAALVFLVLSTAYFAARGARDPLPTALAFTAIVMALDVIVVALAVERSLAMFRSIPGTWLPFALIFLVTWSTGMLMSMMPDRDQESAETDVDAHRHHHHKLA